MTISGIKIEGYSLTVETQDLDIVRCYIGQGGVNVWHILKDDFRLKVFDEVFKI